MDESIAESSADGPPALEVVGDTSAAPQVGAAPAHLNDSPDHEHRRRRWLLPVLLTPLVLVGLVILAWAIDASAGGVPRNVELAGADVGRLSETELAARVRELSTDFASTPVELVSEDRTYATTASEVGLMVDEQRTAAQALDADREGFVLLRPVRWLTSFVDPREVPLALRVSDEKVAVTVGVLEGDDRTDPIEPSIELADGSFHVVPGTDGLGIDPAKVAAALREAATSTSPGDTIRIDVAQGPIPPLGSDDAARVAAADAEALLGEPLEIATGAGSRTIEPDVLRTWAVLSSQPDGTVVPDLDPARVSATLRTAFADVEGHPVDAGFTLEGGVPVIVPDTPGLVCCGDGAAGTIVAALRAGKRTVPLELVDGPASFTAADAQAWGITQAVGGNNAWRNGAPTTAGPGFTTYHDAGGARVINIHRMADIVRGAVIPPGGSFSINDYVGKRTVEKGFVSAGAISNGEHVNEIGGGVSQFATTTFNAAYFAGLDIDEYQAHSEYFTRYPRGREATMGYPSPDLKFTNNTPYGILIWTSYTATSLTVTLYSTPYATAEQTAISEAPTGSCTSVTTTRTRTFPDGHTEQDKFRARYRPGPGQGC
jgi:vancomycin resistance protein YoaR